MEQNILSLIGSGTIGAVICGLIVWKIKQNLGGAEEKIQNAQLNKEVEIHKQEILRLRTDLEKVNAEKMKLISEERVANEKIKTLEAVREKMLNDFKVISFDLLEQQKKSVADEQAKTLGATISPFKEQIEKLSNDFNTQIKEMLKDSNALKDSANNLSEALRKKPKVQGNLGEKMLVENIFDILEWKDRKDDPAGMFETQKNYKIKDEKGVEKTVIPDFVVYLSEGKNFVIDAKVTLNSYIDYVNEQDEAERSKHWKKFVDATRMHINELSEMGYNKVVDDKFDFVCMFMPFEHAYIELMAREKDIYRYAFEKNIAIVTPSLLLPMLRTIDTLMRVEKQNRSVKQAIDLIEKMKDSYVGFLEEYENVGRKINSLKVNFDDAKKKLDGRQGVSGYMQKVIDISKVGGKKKLPSFDDE